MTLKACVVCARPSTSSRCPEHRLPSRGRSYRRAALQTLREEQTCWLCHQPARPDDRLVADHVVPRVIGGPDARSNLRAAHASCNARRSLSQLKH
jgi:5-methylcytosine-specific restriction endonuclease McrA